MEAVSNRGLTNEDTVKKKIRYSFFPKVDFLSFIVEYTRTRRTGIVL